MSPHPKMLDSAESFACRIHNLHIEIIKQIQASNKQYKFRADLHKYYNALNVGDYFMIQIRHEWCPLEPRYKLQVSSCHSLKKHNYLKV